MAEKVLAIPSEDAVDGECEDKASKEEEEGGGGGERGETIVGVLLIRFGAGPVSIPAPLRAAIRCLMDMGAGAGSSDVEADGLKLKGRSG